MTEVEFREHVIDLADLPDPDEQAAHFLKCAAYALNGLTGIFGKPMFTAKTLEPWRKDDGKTPAVQVTEAEAQALIDHFGGGEVEVKLSDEDLALMKKYGGYI